MAPELPRNQAVGKSYLAHIGASIKSETKAAGGAMCQVGSLAVGVDTFGVDKGQVEFAYCALSCIWVVGLAERREEYAC